MYHRSEGFPSETLIVLPQAVVEQAGANPLLCGLLPVAAGLFPSASGHFVERPVSIPDAIFILCCEGSGWVQIKGGARLRVEAGTVVYVPQDTPHAYGADDEDPWTIYWFHARGNDVAAFAALLGLSAEAPLLRLPPGVIEQCDPASILAPLSHDYTTANLLRASTQARSVLTALFEQRTRGGMPRAEEPVERTIAWMRQHIGAKGQLPALARMAGLSVARYSSIFRQRTGYPPIDYFSRLKIRHASYLLDRTTLRVEEIADAVGYEDAFYFSRVFRRIMSQSPREYRATKKG